MDLGPATTWRQNPNPLRSVVNRMRRDFQQRYETERQVEEVKACGATCGRKSRGFALPACSRT